MKQITLEKLFNTLKEKYDIEFPINKMVEAPCELYTTDENGNKVKVTHLIIKEDEIYEIEFNEDIPNIKVGGSHIVITEKGFPEVKNLKQEDKIKTINGWISIKSIKKTGEKTKVYDIRVESETHLYSDPYGIIHHNTYGMEKQLKELFGEFNQPDSKVVYLKGGSISTFGLYKFLYRNRNDKIIVLDDSDALLKDKAVVNMLKSAMDSYPVRELSWESNLVMPMGSLTKEEREEYYAKIDQALEDPQKAGKVGTKLKMPGSFPFTSKIFFISNMTTQEWQKDPHIAALWSRSAHIDVNLSREGIKERILSIIDDIEPDVPREIKEELLEKMYKEGGKLNIRVFAAAAQMRGAAYKGLIDLSDEEAERFATQYI